MQTYLNLPTGMTTRKRNHLPHIDVSDALYFVTFCEIDAISTEWQRVLSAEHHALLRQAEDRFGYLRPRDKIRIERLIRGRLFDVLDLGEGRCMLRDPVLASVVVESLKHFNGVRYDLITHSVMPNHVHAVFRPYSGRPWWRIVGSWKSWTCHEINRITGRKGSLWQDDNFDRIIRNSRHLENAVRYIMQNPRKGTGGDPRWTEQLVFPPYDLR